MGGVDGYIGSEIRENGTVTGGVGGALAGGILACGVGAIVGSASANERVQAFQLVILCDSLSKPEYVYNFVSPKLAIKKASKDYANIHDYANKVNSALKVILARKE